MTATAAIVFCKPSPSSLDVLFTYHHFPPTMDIHDNLTADSAHETDDAPTRTPDEIGKATHSIDQP